MGGFRRPQTPKTLWKGSNSPQKYPRKGSGTPEGLMGTLNMQISGDAAARGGAQSGAGADWLAAMIDTGADNINFLGGVAFSD